MLDIIQLKIIRQRESLMYVLPALNECVRLLKHEYHKLPMNVIFSTHHTKVPRMIVLERGKFVRVLADMSL